MMIHRCLSVRAANRIHNSVVVFDVAAATATTVTSISFFPSRSVVGATRNAGGIVRGRIDENPRSGSRCDEHGDFGLGPLYMDRSMAQQQQQTSLSPTPSSRSQRRDDDNGVVGGKTVRHQRPIYVAATRQHVGKTSVSLALMSHFSKRFGTENVGYMKAVGQQSLQVWEDDNDSENGSGNDNDTSSAVATDSDNDANAATSTERRGGRYVTIDKDVKLVRDHFRLHHLPHSAMSPILIPPGYTKDYLDSRIDTDAQMADIRRAYLTIVQAGKGNAVTVCEGTGHMGVGSIVGACNARVAAELGADVVLVANGGLGRAFDELELNRALCTQYGVNIAGVIINKVDPNKYEQTREYLTKAIQKFWTGPNGEPAPPILGIVPDRPYLGCPALADVESTFGSVLLSGSDHRYRHYDVGGGGVGSTMGLSMVTTDLAAFLRTMQRHGDGARTMFVCHATRDDVILGFLGEYRRRVRRGMPFQSALVVCTGCDDGVSSSMIDSCGIEQLRGISPEVCEMIVDAGPAGPPVLVAAGCSPAEAVERIRTMTPKFKAEDERRVSRAVEHYEPYINFDLLLERTSSPIGVQSDGESSDPGNDGGLAAM